MWLKKVSIFIIERLGFRLEGITIRNESGTDFQLEGNEIRRKTRTQDQINSVLQDFFIQSSNEILQNIASKISRLKEILESEDWFKHYEFVCSSILIIIDETLPGLPRHYKLVSIFFFRKKYTVNYVLYFDVLIEFEFFTFSWN